MSEKGNFVVMLDSIGCLIRVDEDNREWSHDEDEPLIRYSDHDRVVAEQAQRINGLDAMLRQARVWSEEKDKRIEEQNKRIESLELQLSHCHGGRRLLHRRTEALEEEREQLRAEISQYEWLLTQAKTRARDSFRWPGELESANEIHPNAQTGQVEGGHGASKATIDRVFAKTMKMEEEEKAMTELPNRLWIHPGDALKLYITNAVEGADAYIREPEPCVWTKVPDQEGVYTRGCSKGVHYDPDLYCGHCGARIVIEESKE